MAKSKETKKAIDNYEHKSKQRANNPPVGLVTSETDKTTGKKAYQFDPHLDPQLSWSSKGERTSFEVPTVSLHVHERIDARSIIESLRKAKESSDEQMSLFSTAEENPPLREAVDFYKHPHNWSNRLVAGDSLLVMNSLIEKEGLGGNVNLVYFDPPYGIKYGSNFQPFVNRRTVKDGEDKDLNQEPEVIRAFRDTWELGIHSYLNYLRDRLLLSRELLAESGSCMVQISDENVHLVRNLMDEVFGVKNYVAMIAFTKAAGGLEAKGRVSSRFDYLVWYAKDKGKIKYRALYEKRENPIEAGFTSIELKDGTRRNLTREEKDNPEIIPKGAKFYSTILMTKPGPGAKYQIKVNGRVYDSGNRWWGTPKESLERVIEKNRVHVSPNSLRFVRYYEDFPYRSLGNLWDGLGGAANPIYVVQTSPEVIKRCILMTTDPSDLVLDITCGSGTTAFVAEQWGRRWITCDTSRVAITLAKQRLMTSTFDYYALAQPGEGVGSGFKYKTVPHVTMESIANDEAPKTETLYDAPETDSKRVRVTGPFTVEAVPSPNVSSVEDVLRVKSGEADNSIVRTGATVKQGEWREELLKVGIRGEKGKKIEFSRLDVLAGTRWLHADGQTKEKDARRILVSFGPEFAPLEQKQVELALQEAHKLVPKPQLLAFVAFQFDAEAAKDIDETQWPGVGLLKVQMNTDLLTEDLKKKRANNESFWLIGQPDVRCIEIKSGAEKGKWKVSVEGFDYYNVETGQIDSGGIENIAMWSLDTDYDGRSLFPRQVFFPMAGDDEGWAKLANDLKTEIDEERAEVFRGVTSLPFELGKNRQIAVKIVDARGVESLKVVELKK